MLLLTCQNGTVNVNGDNNNDYAMERAHFPTQTNFKLITFSTFEIGIFVGTRVFVYLRPQSHFLGEKLGEKEN